jgi:hypothetical protein
LNNSLTREKEMEEGNARNPFIPEGTHYAGHGICMPDDEGAGTGDDGAGIQDCSLELEEEEEPAVGIPDTATDIWEEAFTEDKVTAHEELTELRKAKRIVKKKLDAMSCIKLQRTKITAELKSITTKYNRMARENSSKAFNTVVKSIASILSRGGLSFRSLASSSSGRARVSSDPSSRCESPHLVRVNSDEALRQSVEAVRRSLMSSSVSRDANSSGSQ